MKKILLAVLFLCNVCLADAPNRAVPEMSTVAPLDNGETFTSPWVDVSPHDSITVAIAASHDCDFTVQFSVNAVDVDSTLSRTYKTTKIIPPERFTVGRKYARITITNDSGSNMTHLRFQTLVGEKTSLNFPIDSTLSQRADATAVRTDSFKIDIGLGRREGAENWRKFGYNADVDTAAEETIWANGGRWSPLDSGETLSVVSSSTDDDSAGTGVRTIRIIGVDENGAYQTEDLTMDGTTPVVTANSWLGVNRVLMLTAGTNKVNVGTITFTASTALTVQATMPAGEGVTQQAFFLCPTDRQLAADGLFWNVRKLSGGSTPRVTIYAYYHDRSAGTIARVFRADVDTSVENSIKLLPANPFIVAEGDYLEFTAVTDVNNTIVNINFWGTTFEDP